MLDKFSFDPDLEQRQREPHNIGCVNRSSDLSSTRSGSWREDCDTNAGAANVQTLKAANFAKERNASADRSMGREYFLQHCGMLVKLSVALTLLAITLAGAAGCAHPRPLTGFARDSTVGRPLRLAVWNQAGLPVDLEVTVAGVPLFVGQVRVAQMVPAIAPDAFREVYVKAGAYRVIIRDRTQGLEQTLLVHLGATANINVSLRPSKMVVDIDDTRHPVYQ